MHQASKKDTRNVNPATVIPCNGFEAGIARGRIPCWIGDCICVVPDTTDSVDYGSMEADVIRILSRVLR